MNLHYRYAAWNHFVQLAPTNVVINSCFWKYLCWSSLKVQFSCNALWIFFASLLYNWCNLDLSFKPSLLNFLITYQRNIIIKLRIIVIIVLPVQRMQNDSTGCENSNLSCELIVVFSRSLVKSWNNDNTHFYSCKMFHSGFRDSYIRVTCPILVCFSKSSFRVYRVLHTDNLDFSGFKIGVFSKWNVLPLSFGLLSAFF